MLRRFIASFVCIQCLALVAESGDVIAAESSTNSKNPVTVLFTDIDSGPNTGGEEDLGTYVSIFGFGFGESKTNQSRVLIAGKEVAAYRYWGNALGGSNGLQQISVQPGPKVLSGSIVVEIGNRRSAGQHRFTVQPGRMFFVSNSGSDQTGVPGDISKPFENAWVALHSKDHGFGPGDTLVIRSGKYDRVQGGKTGKYDFLNFYRKGGKPGKPLMVLGYPGEQVLISNRIRTLVGDSGWITVSGLRFDFAGRSSSGFVANSTADNIRLVNHLIENIDGRGGGAGAIESMAPYTTALGVSINNVGSKSTNFNEAKRFHAVYLNDAASHAEIAWCSINQVHGGRGIQVFHRSGKRSDISIHHNIVANTALDAIILGDGTAENARVFNNLIVNPGDGGIRFDSPDPDFNARAFNNTIVSRRGRAFRFNRYTGSQISIFNNIVYALPPAQYYEQQADNPIAFRNLWYGAGRLPRWERKGVSANPRFRDRDGDNFRLSKGSDAIDAGDKSSVTLPPVDLDGKPRVLDGDAVGRADVDLGAYEAIP